MRGDEFLKPKFEIAKQMRLDGKGSCEGRGYVLKASCTYLVDLLFCLILGQQLQNEFPLGDFERRGSFNRTILCASLSEIVAYKQLPKREFFTKIFPHFQCNKAKEWKEVKRIGEQTQPPADEGSHKTTGRCWRPKSRGREK